MYDFIAQAGIVIIGGLSIYLISFGKDSWRKWGFVAGLIQEAPWFYTAITPTVKWGIVISSLWFTGVFIVGIYREFYEAKQH